MIVAEKQTVPFTPETGRSREVQALWSRLPVRQRLRPVRVFRHLLVRQCDPLCEAVAADIQKPIEETLASELLPLAEACRFLLTQAGRLLRPRRVPARQRPLW